MPAETNNRRDAADSSLASFPAPARSDLVKVARLAVAWTILFLLIAVMASCTHSGDRAKQKDQQINATSKPNDEHGANRANEKHSTQANSALIPPDALPANSAVPVSAGSLPADLGSPATPVASNGDSTHDWALRYEKTEGGPEADLVVRTGDINNLGFGWPKNYDPFSGKSTYPHPFPSSPKPGSPDGTDRMLLGSAVTPADYAAHPFAGDGYSSSILRPCQDIADPAKCKTRQDSMPQSIVLSVGALPAKIDAVLIQIFVDDFQASFHSHFQASLNGTRIPSLEQALNALDQTGPIGKLITVNLLPEYFPLLQSGTVKFLIDDPTTHAQDGYAIDFVRILVNPHKFQYLVSVAVTVKDWDKSTPIAGATVTAALQSASTDASGNCQLSGLPAGLVVTTAVAPGYDANSAVADVVAGQSGHVEIQLHRHEEGTSALEKAIAQTGSAAIYGIHFDTDSAKLRPDSTPALEAVLGLIHNHPESRWMIAGHTDNQGNGDHNQTLSQNRAASVIAWLRAHSVEASRLTPQGFGASRPVADNATANGRALNRRVEIAMAQR
jgi:outer membrane protein OmpA-like peptidoglycan-associated protein